MSLTASTSRPRRWLRRVEALIGATSGTCSIAGGTITRTWIGTEALLFQTGYLTITAEQRLGGKALYRLGYPNREVRQGLNEHLLRHLVQDSDRQTANSIRLARLLEAHDCGGLKDLFHAFFASIPYQWYINNHIADYEVKSLKSRFTDSWLMPTKVPCSVI